MGTHQEASWSSRTTGTSARLTDAVNQVYRQVVELLGVARTVPASTQASLGTNLGKMLGLASVDDYMALREAAKVFAKDSTSLIDSVIELVRAIDPTNVEYQETFGSEHGVLSMA